MPENLLDGAKELLLESISALKRSSITDFIVIGGWCPYLRNESGLRHPGTLDVDILFRDGGREGALGPAIGVLKKSGFILSAKHSFQLLIEKNVRGERLVYNVDLLHPSMGEAHPAMFVDHLDLDIPLDEDERRVKTATSIVLPHSEILFGENLYSEFSASGVDFNLVDFTGMFITKMQSCQKQKRERDAFDLYIALKSNGIDFPRIEQFRRWNSHVDRALFGLSRYLGSKGQVFDQNVVEFSGALSESPAELLLEAIRQTESHSSLS